MGHVCFRCCADTNVAGSADPRQRHLAAECDQRRMAVYAHAGNHPRAADRSTGGWLPSRPEMVWRVCHDLTGPPAGERLPQRLVSGGNEVRGGGTTAGQSAGINHLHVGSAECLCLYAWALSVQLSTGEAIASLQRAADGDRVFGDADARSESIHFGIPCE